MGCFLFVGVLGSDICGGDRVFVGEVGACVLVVGDGGFCVDIGECCRGGV